MILELCDKTFQPWREGLAERECWAGGMSASVGHSRCLDSEAPSEATRLGQLRFVL